MPCAPGQIITASGGPLGTGSSGRRSSRSQSRGVHPHSNPPRRGHRSRRPALRTESSGRSGRRAAGRWRLAPPHVGHDDVDAPIAVHVGRRQCVALAIQVLINARLATGAVVESMMKASFSRLTRKLSVNGRMAEPTTIAFE